MYAYCIKTVEGMAHQTKFWTNQPKLTKLKGSVREK